MCHRARIAPIFSAVLLLIASLSCHDDSLSAEQAAAEIASLYQAGGASSVEIMQVRRQNSLYKVTLRQGPGGDDFKDVFLSLDGKLLLSGVQPLEVERRRLADGRRFTDCLLAAGLRLFGRSHEPMTRAQLDAIGYSAERLLIDCAREEKNCQELGLREYPSLKKGETLYPGLRSHAWIETLTGCK